MKKVKLLCSLFAALLFSGSMWAANVAQIGSTKYTTLADALKAANSGDVIEILNGTWDSTGVGTLTTNEKLAIRYKSLTIQPVAGAKVKFTSQVYLGYDDSSTANATMTVKGLNFENASLALSNYVKATVEGCTFKNTTNTAGTLIVQDACCTNHKSAGEYPASQIIIKNCVIDGSNTSASGIRLRNSGNVTIENNVIKNSQFNGILFESNASVDNTVAKEISITGNTITEWNATNAKDSGRAMRLSLGTLAAGSTVTIEGNFMTKETLGLDAPDFVKATEAENATVSLEGNYWNGKAIAEVSAKTDYYTVNGSAPVVAEVIAEAVAAVDGLKYADLHAALEAGKAVGKTVELLKDVNLTGVAWIPVGTSASPFEGTFDGKNFTITGLNVEVESSAALIGCCNGNNTVVKNVTFDGATIKATNGDYAAVVIAQWNAKSIENVTVKNSSITATGEKAAGITAGAYIECHNCTVDNCIITCTEQPGAIASYVAGTPIIGCKSLNNTITATVSRAGGLVGKYECDDNGDTNLYKLNNNVVSNCTVTAPDMAGALASQIMGAYAVYEMKNNVLDATLSATKTSPIGILRDGQNAAFTGALAKNITGNWWTDKTYANCQFSYTNVAAGVDEQVIDRGVAKIGDNCFQTLEAAVAAAQANETIKLIADVPLPSEDKFLRFADNVTFDLNSKSITSGVIDTNANYDYLDGCAYVYEGTGLTIQNGTMIGVSGSGATANYSYALYIGNDEDGNIPATNVTVKDITFPSGGVNSYLATGVTIKDCDVTVTPTAYYAVYACRSTVTVDGGLYKCGGNNIVLCAETEATYGATITVNGGSFQGSLSADAECTISLKGGIYSVEPADAYIAENYQKVDNTDPATKDDYPWAVGVATSLTEIRDVVANRFATICWAKELVAGSIQNAEVYSIIDKDASGNIVLEQVTENLVAGKPYIVKGTATGKMKAQETGVAAAEASNDNGLYGSLVANYNITADAADKYAFIANDNKYYTIQNGGTLTVATNRAYIRLDMINAQTPAPGRKSIKLLTGEVNTTTELMNLNANANVNGKMILNGQFVIVKDGKMFNAQGAQL